MRTIAARLPMIVLALLVALASGGCGDDDAASDRLIVTLDDGAGRALEAPVSCADSPRFCNVVREILASPDDEVCTQIYGGPETITIRGSLDREAVDITVGRTDGCEIDRYERLVAELPATAD